MNDLLTIVGKNESGKTSLLKALWRLNPHQEEVYEVKKDWPRGIKEQNPEKAKEDSIVVSVKFRFSEQEKKNLAKLNPEFLNLAEVIVSRNYKGEYIYDYLPGFEHKIKPSDHQIGKAVSEALNDEANKLMARENFGLKQDIFLVLKQYSQQSTNKKRQSLEPYIQQCASKIKQMISSVSTDSDRTNRDTKRYLSYLVDRLNKLVADRTAYIEKNPLLDLDKFTIKHIPEFIYMDEYKVFRGSTRLDELEIRRSKRQLTDEDKTFLLIIEMAGLNLEEELKKVVEESKLQRILDFNQASQEVTRKIANRWTQKDYEVIIQADGNFFVILVKDKKDVSFIPLEERSKGFQWFFSFDMYFSYETEKSPSSKVILLDEPGLHLHASAQKDLLERLNYFSTKHQIIYTTHLPFMIDCLKLDNIYFAQENYDKGSQFSNRISFSDLDTQLTLQAALGISWSQSFLFSQFNLVVEGITDFWYLNHLSSLFGAIDRGLDDNLFITPAGGGSKAAYLATILCGQKLNCMLLLDSDEEGHKAYDQLVKNWLLKDRYVFRLGDILDIKNDCAIEDLFDRSYFIDKVNFAYSRELKDRNIQVDKNDERSVIEIVSLKLEEFGLKLNKGRISKIIINDLKNKTHEDIDEVTKIRFGKVFDCLNQAFNSWK